MSLKAEIETWVEALDAYEAQDFERALSCFTSIGDSSKILFNIGLIHATLGAHMEAVQTYRDATSLDPHLAIAYFQCGVSNFLLGKYGDACSDFDEAYQHMRENTTIDYEQIGLKFRLYSCEILFNRGLSMIYMGQAEAGMRDLERARSEKQTDEHGVIDEAFVDRGDGYTVFSIPVGVLYRPSDVKIKNMKTRNYLGKAKLVAATEERDAFTGFTGSTRAALDRIGPVSTGPNRPLPSDDAGMARSASASAALGGNASGSSAVGLRRRPTDTSASVTMANGAGTRSPPSPVRPGLGRSNTVASSTGLPYTQTSPMLRSSSMRGAGTGAAVGAKGLPTPPRSTRSPTPTSPYKNGNTTISPPQTPPPAKSSPLTRKMDLSKPKTPEEQRDSEYLDDVLDDYNRMDEFLGGAREEKKSVAAWAQKSARPQLRSGGSAPSSIGNLGGSIRRPAGGPPPRKASLRQPMRTGRYTAASASRYDDEEGYGSGEYEDTLYEMIRIRVKLHYDSDVRGMSITPEMPFAEFIDKLEAKFGRGNFKLRFKDEDGAVISLVDDSDWESAIDAARETANGRAESKLDVFME